jgi:hypothetical protein
MTIKYRSFTLQVDPVPPVSQTFPTQESTGPKLHWSIQLHTYPGIVLFLSACRWQIGVIGELLRKKAFMQKSALHGSERPDRYVKDINSCPYQIYYSKEEGCHEHKR